MVEAVLLETELAGVVGAEVEIIIFGVSSFLDFEDEGVPLDSAEAAGELARGAAEAGAARVGIITCGGGTSLVTDRLVTST